MAEITYLNLTDATERSTSVVGGTTAEVTQRTIAWADLTGAGFAASDVVFIIWNWSLGGPSTTNDALADLRHGTAYAIATSFMPVIANTEPMDTTTLNGHKHMGWVEEHTLVANENFYFGLGSSSALSNMSSASFSITFLKKSDLDADDYRYNAVSNALAVTTTFQTDATVTLPSTGGDDWLILGCGDWDVASATVNLEQRLQVAGSNFMTFSTEGEATTEQLPLMSVYYHAAAGNSDVVNFQAREDSSSSFVLDRSRILALRMEAFADHIGLYDATSDALSASVDTYVETGTVSLSLSATGNVFVVGQSIVTPFDTNTDPYLRLQEGGTDIVSAQGRASDHARDGTDLIPIYTHTVGSMASGTKTIDMDVATDEAASASNTVDERTLVAFSMELASSGHTGSIAMDLAPPTISAAGDMPHEGTAALDVTTPAVAADGHMDPSGAADVAVSTPDLAAQGAQEFIGAIDADLSTPDMAADGSHDSIHSGAIDALLSTPTVLATGAQEFTGAGIIAVPELDVTGEGHQHPRGNAEFIMATPDLTAAGTHGSVHTGTASIVLATPDITAEGVRKIIGIGSIAVPAIDLQGVGAMQPEGAAGIELSEPSVTASGSQRFSGVGVIVLSPLEIVAIGEFSLAGAEAHFSAVIIVSAALGARPTVGPALGAATVFGPALGAETSSGSALGGGTDIRPALRGRPTIH